ncbi:DUF7262 family protein [Halobellus captivus]|uniref:DUF7262 family protein n=1 Tax=Halobellus captivus TaxID=2592614 RepID=UPI001EF0F3D6|nr:hypothetical protein [Halobellus captivus]
MRELNSGRTADPETDRAQLATSLVEAAVGALLILSVVAGFVWVPTDATEPDAELDRIAVDALAVLDAEPPVGDGHSRLTAACRSPDAFETERAALGERLDDVLPTAVFGRVETPHGVAGAPQPNGIPSGQATLPTAHCTVTIRVWYV